MANMAKDQGILLESGTNEMELLVFMLGSTPFGVNVAKVREIVQHSRILKVPNASDAVEGVFKLRDRVLTLVNLSKHFGMQSEQNHQDNGMTIIVEFNNTRCGILVDGVDRIHRLTWNQILPPSQYLVNLQAPITGMVNLSGKVVLIVDFETIVNDILGAQSVDERENDSGEEIRSKDTRIILADDSSVVRRSLLQRLNQNGYENLTVCTDGQAAWETMEAGRNKPDGPCDLVLSDIEMPQMDGLHLTKRIKSDPQFRNIPVILFSSLITEDNFKKGQAVGADAQVSKPDSHGLIEAIENCLQKMVVAGTEVS